MPSKDEGRSDLALAEYYLLTENKSKCRKLAAKAKKELDKSAKIELLRADDLIDLARDEKEEAKEKEKEKEKGKEK